MCFYVKTTEFLDLYSIWLINIKAKVPTRFALFPNNPLDFCYSLYDLI